MPSKMLFKLTRRRSPSGTPEVRMAKIAMPEGMNMAMVRK